MNLTTEELLTAALSRERVLVAQHHLLLVKVKDLLYQIDHLGSISFSRDVTPYKAEMVWDNTVWKLKDMVKLYEEVAGGEAKIL